MLLVTCIMTNNTLGSSYTAINEGLTSVPADIPGDTTIINISEVSAFI